MTKPYTDMIGAEISAAGWTWGSVEYFDTEAMRTMYAVDAHKAATEHRCVVRAETLLTALMELQGMTRNADDEHNETQTS